MALPTTARNNPDDYKVTCTLTDGTVIEGYISIPLTKIITSQLYELDISDTYKGKARTYTSEEVKRIVYTSTLNDSLPLIYESVKAQKSVPNLFKKNPKPFKKPVFLRLIYEGKNVNGYITPTTDYTVNKKETIINYVWRYYYLKKTCKRLILIKQRMYVCNGDCASHESFFMLSYFNFLIYRIIQTF